MLQSPRLRLQTGLETHPTEFPDAGAELAGALASVAATFDVFARAIVVYDRADSRTRHLAESRTRVARGT
jgi:ATP phosphoribosyltransferase regulatory subunit HisZ